MEDWQKGGVCNRIKKDEDFDEEDVWLAATETEDSSPKMKKFNGHYNTSSVFSSSSSSSSWQRRGLHSSPRKIKIPAADSSSQATNEAKLGQRSSAPVNIPDWSKIYGKNRGFGSWGDEGKDDGFVHHNGNGSYKLQNFDEEYDNDDGGDGDDDEDELIPPHEWIAKKLAGTQISSSVYEGIGRTLKGRDLSKLRNAILTKTGFLE